MCFINHAGPFKVTERVGRLAYKLDIPQHWRVHNVFSIAQLEPAPNPSSDPYERRRSHHPPTVFVEQPLLIEELNEAHGCYVEPIRLRGTRSFQGLHPRASHLAP